MKTWITNDYHIGIQASPTNIEQTTTDDVIQCTGWWQAGNWQNGLWASGKGGDDEYYIKKWFDQSGESNHLIVEGLNAPGQGPRAYGSGSNEHGSSSDEVNGYPVAQFEDMGVSAQGQLYLRCIPGSPQELGHDRSEAATENWSCAAIVRYEVEDFPATQVVMGNTHTSDTLGVNGILYDTDLSIAGMKCIAHVGADTMTSDASVLTHKRPLVQKYNCLGVFCVTASTASTDGEYRAWMNGTLGTAIESGGSVGGTAVETSSEYNKFTVGKGAFGTGAAAGLHGRIVEMACWKSDNPISAYKQQQIYQYWLWKFNL